MAEMAYPGRKGTDRVTEECWKCSGRGWIEAFGGIDGGRCWACMGQGGKSVLVSSIRARERRQAKRAAEQAQTDADRLERVGSANGAAIAALVSAFPAFAEALDERGRPATYAASEAMVFLRDGGDIEGVVAHYRWLTGETVTNVRRNRFPGRCHVCGRRVCSDEGWIGQAVQDGWRTYCQEHQPAS